MQMTHAELTEAAKLAKSFLKGFESFSQLATAFDQASMVLRAKEDAETALAGLQDKLQTAREQVAKEIERQAEAARVGEQRLAEIDTLAKVKLDEAKAEAAAIVAKANATAEKREIKARDNVRAMETIEAEAGERVAGLRAEATQLEARVAAAKAEIAKLLGQA